MSGAHVFWCIRDEKGFWLESGWEGHLVVVGQDWKQRATWGYAEVAGKVLDTLRARDLAGKYRLVRITRWPHRGTEREVFATHAVTYADFAAHMPSLGLLAKVQRALESRNGAPVRIIVEKP